MQNYNVKDSSLYRDPHLYKAQNYTNSSIHIGIIKSAFINSTNQYIYEVEINVAGAPIVVNCRLMSRYGNPMNHEEFNLLPYVDNKLPTMNSNSYLDSYAHRNGEIVLVAFLNGNPRDGVILGSLTHATHKTKLSTKEQAYLSEFNGVETKIKDDGTYKVTWKSKPKNVNFNPVYDELIGGSYYGFDTNGSFYVTDNALMKSQFITIKKDKNNICIVSGDNRLEIGKTDSVGADSLGIKTTVTTIQSKDFNIISSNKIKLKTQEMHIKTTKFAIGNNQVELIDTLLKLIKEIGNIVVTSPWGPCSAINTSPNWAQITQIRELLSTLQVSIQDPVELKPSSDSDNFKD